MIVETYKSYSPREKKLYAQVLTAFYLFLFCHQAEEPLSIIIPHCAQRNPARDVVIKTLTSHGKWVEVPTNDVTVDDIKEFKFVECRLAKPATLAVITRIKVY